MTVKEFADQFHYTVLALPDENRTIKGGYAGDLLSWVMGKLVPDQAWVTIMSNINIVAVATLADPSCIILSEQVIPDDEVIAKAKQQGINLLSSAKDTFSVCLDIAKAL